MNLEQAVELLKKGQFQTIYHLGENNVSPEAVKITTIEIKQCGITVFYEVPGGQKNCSNIDNIFSRESQALGDHLIRLYQAVETVKSIMDKAMEREAKNGE